MEWASRPSSSPRTRSREERDRLDPGSESGVTNSRQSRVPYETVPPIRLLSRGTRDFILAMTRQDSSVSHLLENTSV